MLKTIKKFISLIMSTIMIVIAILEVLPLKINAATGSEFVYKNKIYTTYTEADIAAVKVESDFINNETKRSYVNGKLKEYLLSNNDDYRVTRQLEDDKCVIFFFEGCSNNINTIYGDYNNYHMSAVCIVVREVNDVPTIIYKNYNCTTLPDAPRGVDEVPTVIDGIYNIVTRNHGDKYAAFQLRNTAGGTNITSIRSSTNISKFDESGNGINIHARFPYKKLNGRDNTTINSQGCLLVGAIKGTSESPVFDEYNSFIQIITGVSNARTNIHDTTGKKYEDNNIEQYCDYGIVIIDRIQYRNELLNIYGSDKLHTAEEIVNELLNGPENKPVLTEAEPIEKVYINTDGQIVDSLNGINALYCTYNVERGIYCCAQYVKNYYNTLYGLTVTGLTYNNTPKAEGAVFIKTESPKVGDIGYQLNGNKDGGHWFIVKKVNSNGTFTVIDQNWVNKNDVGIYYKLNRTVSFNETPGLVFYTLATNNNSITKDLKYTINFTTPLNGASSVAYDKGITFSWTPVANVSYYEISIRDLEHNGDECNPSDYYNNITDGSTSLTIENLIYKKYDSTTGTIITNDNGFWKANVNYRAYIRAMNSDNTYLSTAAIITFATSNEGSIISDTNNWLYKYSPAELKKDFHLSDQIIIQYIQEFLDAYPGVLNSQYITNINNETMLYVDGEYFTLTRTYDTSVAITKEEQKSYFDYSNSIETNIKNKEISIELTPAEIIYYSCVENNCNIIFLLANIQKEQSLIESKTTDVPLTTRLNRAVGYMKFVDGIRMHYTYGEQRCNFFGQVIAATNQYALNYKNGMSMEASYNSYTTPKEIGNMLFDYFYKNIYEKYVLWFNNKLGISYETDNVTRDIVLILDISGSMAGTKITNTKAAACSFIDQTLSDSTNIRIAIVKYGSNANTIIDFTSNADQLKSTINSITTGGSTNIYDGLILADSLLKTSISDKKSIILMSDGEANIGTYTNSGYRSTYEGTEFYVTDYGAAIYDLAKIYISENNYNIYTLGFGLTVGSDGYNLLKYMCSQGCFWSITSNNINDLVFIYGDIANSIISGSNCIVIRIACPVNVQIVNNGEVLNSELSFLSQKTSYGKLNLSDNAETKILYLDKDKYYNTVITGTGSGTMDLTISYPNNKGNYIDIRRFNDIIINEGTRIKFKTNMENDLYLYIDNNEDDINDITMIAEENGNGYVVNNDDYLKNLYYWMILSGGINQTYTITASSGEGGIITPNGVMTITGFENQTYTITPDEGFIIKDLLVNGVSVGALTTYTFSNITVDQTISAVFEKQNQIISGNPFINKQNKGEYYPSYIISSSDVGGNIIPKGTIMINHSESQSFTIIPDEGYMIKEVLINGVNVGISTNYTIPYSFIHQTISTIFEKIPLTDWKNPFNDISKKDKFYKAVEFVNKNGLFFGVSDTEFAPDVTMTRAMFVTVLGRFAGINLDDYEGSSYADVKEGQWYSPYVEWAAQNGIVNGYDNANFGILDEITIEQAVVIIYRYSLVMGYDIKSTSSLTKFTDNEEVSDWAVSAMEWAVGNDIYSGKSYKLLPLKSASRALVAEMLYDYDKISK